MKLLVGALLISAGIFAGLACVALWEKNADGAIWAICGALTFGGIGGYLLENFLD